MDLRQPRRGDHADHGDAGKGRGTPGEVGELAENDLREERRHLSGKRVARRGQLTLIAELAG